MCEAMSRAIENCPRMKQIFTVVKSNAITSSCVSENVPAKQCGLRQSERKENTFRSAALGDHEVFSGKREFFAKFSR